MNERDLLFLGHIAAAIASVHDFTVEGPEAFLVDLKTQSAVIRQLEIIGEAVKQLSEEAKAAEPKTPWRLIAGTRDRLIHAYFQVDIGAVWAMVEQDLPALQVAVDRMRFG